MTDADTIDAAEERRSAWRAAPLRALLAGALVAFSLPPWGWWPLAFVGTTLFAKSLGTRPTRRQAAANGFAFGLAWMAIGMCWMWFLTVPGYVFTALLFAGFHTAAAAIAPTGPWRTIGRPAAHTLVEAIRLGFPFGGVPLATLGISQAGGPLLGLGRVGGVVLITWVVFQVGASLAGDAPFIPATARRRTSATGHLQGVIGLAAVVVAIVLAALAPHGTNAGGVLTVAAVQGGGEQGTSALDVPSSRVTDALLEATRTIEPDPELDLVVWPENGIDVDGQAFVDSPEFDAVAAEAERLGVPFAVGVTVDSEYSTNPRDDAFVNAQVVVTPDGDETSRYEKVRIVPFGEYVPLRGLLETLGAPLDEVPSDAVAGSGPARVELPDGTRLGVMISWEVFFGGRGRAAADGDTALLLNPTNGASYTGTVLQTQQVASSALRATETGRWVVQVSPTGFTAFVGPDGSVHQRTDVSEQRVITMDVPLRTGTTWYMRTGNWPWAILMAALLIVAWWRSVRLVPALQPPV